MYRPLASKPRGGQTVVEYALLLVLIAVLAFGAIQLVGGSVDTSFSTTNSSLNGGGSGGSGGGGGGGGDNPAEFTPITPPPYNTDNPIQFDGPDSASSWEWDFDEDGITDDTTEDPEWWFDRGTWLVSLTVNGSDSYQLAVEVVDQVTDDFNRTVNDAWGTASSGWGPYQMTNPATNASVNGTKGVLLDDDFTEVGARLTIPQAWYDEKVTMEFEFTETISGGTSGWWHFGCGGNSMAFYDPYEVLVETYWNTLPNEAYFTANNEDGTWDSWEPAPAEYSANGTYKAKMELDGTQISVKIWPATLSEPASWQMQHGDPNTDRSYALNWCQFYADGSDGSFLIFDDLDIRVYGANS